MKTIDKFLIDFMNDTSVSSLVFRTKVIQPLTNISKQLLSGEFITKNQADLIISKFNEMLEDCDCKPYDELNIFTKMREVLNDNCWSQPFVRIKPKRTIHIKDNIIVINFTFSTKIRSVLKNLFSFAVLKEIVHGEQFNLSFTEINLVLAIKALKPFKFKIPIELLEHYKVLTSLSEVEIRNQFYFPLNNEKFKLEFSKDVGDDYDDIIIKDRHLRYQYLTDITLPHDSLTSIIADRNSTNIWLDSKQYSLTEVLFSLQQLKRFPLLFVFNKRMTSSYTQTLMDIKKSLDEIGLKDKIGVYFRLPNVNSIKTSFNKLIAEYHYNAFFDDTTQIVMIENGKIPKFIIDDNWGPKSVIMIDNNLRNNKAYTYASHSDLVISYSETKPLKIELGV